MLRILSIPGCKEQNLCNSTDGCQGRGEQFCAKFGCCSTNLCTANYTMGKDFKTTSSSTAMLKSSPTPAVQPSSPAVQPSSPVVQPSSQIVQPSSPAVQPSSSAAPMTTKPEMAATSSIKPEMAATSSIPQKMTSKPIMPTAKMSKVNPMTSSKPEVKPTGSKEDMMSSSGKEMKPSAVSRDGVHSTEILVILPTVDDRPTCAGSGQVFATFVVVAIALLCSIF